MDVRSNCANSQGKCFLSYLIQSFLVNVLSYATTSLCQKPAFIEEIWVRVSCHQNPSAIPIPRGKLFLCARSTQDGPPPGPWGRSSPELPKELWEIMGKTSPSSLWPLRDSDQEPPVADTVRMKPSSSATHQLLPTNSNIPVLHPYPRYGPLACFCCLCTAPPNPSVSQVPTTGRGWV